MESTTSKNDDCFQIDSSALFRREMGPAYDTPVGSYRSITPVHWRTFDIRNVFSISQRYHRRTHAGVACFNCMSVHNKADRSAGA